MMIRKSALLLFVSAMAVIACGDSKGDAANSAEVIEERGDPENLSGRQEDAMETIRSVAAELRANAGTSGIFGPRSNSDEVLSRRKGELKKAFDKLSNEQLFAETQKRSDVGSLIDGAIRYESLEDTMPKRRRLELLAMQGLGPLVVDKAVDIVDTSWSPSQIPTAPEKIEVRKGVPIEGPKSALDYDSLLNTYMMSRRDMLSDDNVADALAQYLFCNEAEAVRNANEFDRPQIVEDLRSRARAEMNNRLDNFQPPGLWTISDRKPFGDYDFANQQFAFNPYRGATTMTVQPQSRNAFCFPAQEQIPGIFEITISGLDSVNGLPVDAETGKRMASNRYVELTVSGPAVFGDIRMSDKTVTGFLRMANLYSVPMDLQVTEVSANWRRDSRAPEMETVATYTAETMAAAQNALQQRFYESSVELWELGEVLSPDLLLLHHAALARKKTPDKFDRKRPILLNNAMQLVIAGDNTSSFSEPSVGSFFRGDKPIAVKVANRFCPDDILENEKNTPDMCLSVVGNIQLVVTGLKESRVVISPEDYPQEIKDSMARNRGNFPPTTAVLTVQPSRREFKPDEKSLPLDYVVADVQRLTLVSEVTTANGEVMGFLWQPSDD